MPPLRYAVSLIYGIERNVHLREEVQIGAFGKSFGSHIQQLSPAIQHIFLHVGKLRTRQGGVHKMSHTIFLQKAAQRIHLILHERNQGRHHYCRTIFHQCRQLVAQRLATPRWHQHKGIVALQNALDDIFLFALKLLKAKKLLQTAINTLF